MVDFHTHILPGVDDGSKSVSDSLEMLRMERDLGIDTVLLTPHFYADQNSPVRFLARRERAWNRLEPELEEGMPAVRLGAEVQYFEGMANVESLSDLTIEGTNLLLLEMPFFPWNAQMIRTVLELNESGKMQVVLAHIERYTRFAPENAWELFHRSGVLMQVNASAFDGWLKRRKTMKMMRNGQFQLLGSDCHNLTSRKPNWDLVPDEAWEEAQKNAQAILRLE